MQAGVQDSGLFLQAAQLAGSLQQVIIDVQGRSHMHTNWHLDADQSSNAEPSGADQLRATAESGVSGQYWGRRRLP
jgi:hypothetical protein